MTVPILPSRTLMGIYRDDRLERASTFWTQAGGFDRRSLQSTRESIIFEKVDAAPRALAPFVLPTNTGKPVFKRTGSDAKLLKPAYIKPRDAVVPQEQFNRRPGDLYTDTPRTPQQNRDQEIVDIVERHKQVIDRRKEWMCAQVMIWGQVTVEYQDGPSVTISYDRDASLTHIKTTDLWTTSYDIVGDLQEWRDRGVRARFGGQYTRLIVGTEVWPVMRRNEEFMKLMDMNIKNSDVSLKRSLIPTVGPQGEVAVFVGVIENLEVWVYNDFYEDNDGNQVPFMNPRDIVMTTSDVGGVMGYGAILDHDADLQAVEVFPKMWRQEDPSAINIMHQCSPLPIQPYPNRTFHARVVEEDSNSAGS